MRKILVVDDEPGTNTLAAEYLRLSGYEIVQCRDGAGALRLLEAGGTFDAVVLDIHMPGLSGLEVCRALRQDPATRALPVVMLSASTSDADAQARAAGAQAFIAKPFSPKDLAAELKRLLP